MSEAIDQIRVLARQAKIANDNLKASMRTLEAHLNELLSNEFFHVRSVICTLESYGDEERVYGFLSYSPGRLSVAYRTTEEDLGAPFLQIPSEPTYTVQKIESCSNVWLRALLKSDAVESLLDAIQQRMAAEASDAAEGLASLVRIIDGPKAQVDDALSKVGDELGFTDVVALWKRAQNAVLDDPMEAATRACSLLESTIRHILEEKAIAEPKVQTIGPLYKALRPHLNLDPRLASSQDIQKVLTGIISIVDGIGSLRTHSGSAHGRGPGDPGVSRPLARLAVNSAGVAATYIMERFRDEDAQ